jgi:poly(3-hydroxybutyrate) depolymerase
VGPNGSAATGLGFYETGATPLFACQADPRFSYCLYVPQGYQPESPRPLELMVLVHGTGRNPFAYRDAAAGFADEHGCLVLCPLFPCGIPEPRVTDNYKFLSYRGIRFDLLLLSMISEVGSIYRVDTRRFCLFGFSGGAHFAHRFFYVHPERLRAVAIDAPGVVTLLDHERDWWCGVRNFAGIFAKELNLDAMRAVAVQTIVGGDDTATWEIAVQPGWPFWMEGITDSGSTRVERLASLRDSWQKAGIGVEHLVVPGVGHELLLAPALDFFRKSMRA